jgi:hypothetical protein
MSRGRHGQVHCTVQIMESPAKKEHDSGLSFCEREGCVVEHTQEDAWRDDNSVREFCSGACMCIFWLRPKENLLALASDGFLQKSGVGAVARDKTDRKEDRRCRS